MALNETPSLYQAMSEVTGSAGLIEKRDALFIALALALGGMLAIIAALVWPQRQS